MRCRKLSQEQKVLTRLAFAYYGGWTFLARLFSEKTRCIALTLACLLSCAETWHFVISLLLLKIFTWNAGVCVQYLKSNPYYQGIQNAFFFIIMPFFEDGTYYGITRGGRAGVRVGGRRPVLCPEHISKTTLARVMKFHGGIDLIQGECSAQES